ncbi:MAG: outer membrane lipoprotein LolB [Gammaproteobacteria bacterium]|nr:outer membrane lipoprotein LolB [Gammaproteobacteria bacterium]
MRTARSCAAVAGLLTFAVLGGCATAPPLAQEPWGERSVRINEIAAWEARGRLSVTTPEDSVQGNFEWRQRPDWVEVRFRGPMGVGGLFVYGPPEMLTAIGRDGEQVVLHEPEADLAALFGFGLPVQSLRFWLLGLADQRHAHHFDFDELGLPRTLEQRGWLLTYSGWRSQGDELLPRRIDLASPGLDIRIVLDTWMPGLDPP